MDIKMNQDASILAHMVVAESLRGKMGVEPRAVDVARVLALAFGDALGIATMSGKPTEEIDAINALATTSYNAMIATIVADSCEGRA